MQRADVRAGDVLRRSESPLLNVAVTYTTDLGSLYSVIGVAAALAAAGRLRAAADVFGVGAAAWNISQYSKTRVRRERPYEKDAVRRLIRPPTGSSFPSGHAAVGAAVFTMLAEQAATRRGRRILQAVATYVGLSRIYLGVHYPTDILGGAGMGLTIGALWRGPMSGLNAAALRALARLSQRLARRAGSAF